MNSRHLARTALAAVFLAAMPLATDAAQIIAAPRATPTPTGAASATQAQRLSNLKTKGAAEIDRRVASLNAALEKLVVATKLTPADKTALTQQLQAEIAGLTALKTKLSAETDLAAARADVVSIVTDYRVYALMAPKARMVAAIDRLAVVADKLTTLQAELSDKAGATDQQKLDDMATQIAPANTAISGLTAKLLALQPTDYNANHAVLVDYRTKTKSAFNYLKAARDDAKAVITDLKTAKSNQ